MPRPAAIDNDFLGHLADTRGQEAEVCGMIRRFFQGLDYAPELHELICRHETPRDHPVILRLLREKVVEIRPLRDILTSRPGGGRYYEMLVRNLYKEMKGADYPCDVFEEWIRHQSLGEVHCVAMCFLLNYICVLSDDGDAKDLRQIMSDKTARDVPIYSRADCRERLRAAPGCGLTSNELKRLCHEKDT